MTTITHTVFNEEGEARVSSSYCIAVSDGSPTYTELLAERDNLLKRIERLENDLSVANQRAAEVWGVVEDVACGATLECTKCGKPRPCLCMDQK